jgi:hypothetical protein
MPKRRFALVMLSAFAFLIAVAAAAAAEGGRGARQAPPAARTPGGPIYIPPANQNISGVWWVQRYSAKIAPVGGGELPFTPSGLEQYRKNIAALKDGTLKDEARRICVPDGVPRIAGNPYPFQIIQTPGQVTITYELNHVIRPFYLGEPLPPADDLELFPRYSGYSSAHWEGDTLVIESAGFHQDTFIDATGVPHSEQLRTVERLRKVNDRTLEAVITVTDPAMFTRPWQTRFVYDLHPGERLRDYNCGERLRDISQVPGVAEARRARGQ